VPSKVADMVIGGGIRRRCYQTRWHERRKRELTSGAHMAVTGEGKDVTAGMRKPEERAAFRRIRQGASSRLD
jgi:hypothetical protein